MLARTPEQIAQRIVSLLDQRNTKPGEHDMFGAIASRLANEEISGDALNSGVAFGVERGWFSMRGPRIWRAAATAAEPAG
jgi:hypothetical protein